ncbi:hypothetical protein WICPIJ_003170 [Wickerhamomyces pijperi]|uniref:Uncharacterized protein n=1 Tax=Wickerhamomyces pijperi TaxID=599730 RepID=A0A9P8TPI0_WICPI|nr:hypothetical protein WICPIJ_003170 [Wickerhamomyces pijperi]
MDLVSFNKALVTSCKLVLSALSLPLMNCRISSGYKLSVKPSDDTTIKSSFCNWMLEISATSEGFFSGKLVPTCCGQRGLMYCSLLVKIISPSLITKIFESPKLKTFKVVSMIIPTNKVEDPLNCSNSITFKESWKDKSKSLKIS